ncbi:hypothetical protein TrVFT333_001823 [Trichoderma virens FT-333]|nr:hypothetical protein TrVFT333_001823 [Trichoderma virens FT-333]
MVKRKYAASSASPRKKAKLDEPTETLANAPRSSSPSSPTSSSSSTSQRREKRKRSDSTLLDDPDESDASINTKRAKTQSPTSSRRPSPSLNPEGTRPVPDEDSDDSSEWELHDDHPEKFAHVFWEPTDLSEAARERRRRFDLMMKGYTSCVCGKMHYAIGRKSWHYPGQEPELEDPEEQLPEPDEPHVRSRPVSAYQSRGQERLLSPELSDDEAAAGNAQPNFAPSDVSSVREPSVELDLPAPVIAEVSAISPTNSPIVTPTANNSRASRGRNNAQQNISKPTTPRRTHRKNKNKNKKDQESKDKTVKQQPRNRKPKTTLMVEEPVVSRRSSRRNAGSQLYFLDDSGKACLVAASSR